MSEFKIAQYRLQLPPDARWTEWRNIDIPVKEDHVLSLQICHRATPEQINEFMKQFKWW